MNANLRVTLGGYVAVPIERREVELFYAGLRAMPRIKGIEVPCGRDGQFGEAFGEGWFLDQRSPSWAFTLTSLPSTMMAVAEASDYGLASKSETGRTGALRHVMKIRQTMERLQEMYGIAVPTVLLHTAPRKEWSSPYAFARSLAEILTWDWGETAAIETRGPDGPVHHVQLAASVNALYGVVFAGASATVFQYGLAWTDAHLPLAGTGGSLMTVDQIERTMRAAGREVEYGVKVGVRPRNSSAAARLPVVKSMINAVVRVHGSLEHQSGEASK